MLEALTHWHWLGLGLLLIIADMVIGANFFILWLGLSAGLVGFCMLLIKGIGWETQIILFSLFSIASIGFWTFYLKRNPTQSDKPRLNRRTEQHIGRIFYLETGIENGWGTVLADGTTWRVKGDNMPKGAKVKVVSVDGVVLMVEPAE